MSIIFGEACQGLLFLEFNGYKIEGSADLTSEQS